VPALLENPAVLGRGNEENTPRLQRRDLTVRADSVRAEDRSVVATICTDAPVVVRDYATWDLIEEVLVSGGAEFTPHVVLLEDHNHYTARAVFGHAAEHAKTSNGYESRVFFSEPANEHDPVAIHWQRVKGKHLRGVSIGYEPLEYTDILPGKSAVIGGRNYTAGRLRLRVTRSYVIYEVSLVAIGADPDALMAMRHFSLSTIATPCRRRRRHLTNSLSTPSAGPRRRRTRNA
jgi:hypothetical protein